MDVFLLLVGFWCGRALARVLGETFNAFVLMAFGFKLSTIQDGYRRWVKLDKGWHRTKVKDPQRFRIILLPRSATFFRQKRVFAALAASLLVSCVGWLGYMPLGPVGFSFGAGCALIASPLFDFIPHLGGFGYEKLVPLKRDDRENARSVALDMLLARFGEGKMERPDELLEVACSMPDNSVAHGKALFYRAAYSMEAGQWSSAWDDLSEAAHILNNPNVGLFYLVRGDRAFVAAYGLDDIAEAKRILQDLNAEQIKALGLSTVMRDLTVAVVALHHGWHDEARAALNAVLPELQQQLRASANMENLLVFRAYADLRSKLARVAPPGAVLPS
jgi:hypothetical protein